MAVPYATATSGAKAREEITKLLARFGCADVGFMDSLRDHSVLLQFTHRGRVVQLRPCVVNGDGSHPECKGYRVRV